MAFPLYDEILTRLPLNININWEKYWNMTMKLQPQISEVILALVLEYCDRNSLDINTLIRTLSANQATVINLAKCPEDLRQIICIYLNQVVID